MSIQSILNEVDELNAIQSSMTLTSSSEPYQKEWEDEWELQGNTLPITVGTELYWNDGSQLRGLYMVVDDVFTIPTRWAKLLDNNPGFQTSRDDPIPSERNIWVKWWFDNTHLIGVGTYDGVTGTYKLYMDGTVEFITADVAVDVHPAAQTMVVQDGSDLKLYDLLTDTLGPTIDTVSWTADLYAPVKFISDSDISEAGWGFAERIAWVDETDENNLDFYYIDGDEIHFYEDGVGQSLLFSVPSGGNDAVTICYQSDVLAISYESNISVLSVSEVYLATVFDLDGNIIFELGATGEEVGSGTIPFLDEWGEGLYRAWHFRKTPGDANFIDLVQPIKPVRYGESQRIDSLPEDYMRGYGTHTWQKYLRYDIVNNRYVPGVIYDTRLTAFNNLGEELTIVPSDVTTQPDVVLSDRHRWGAPLISNRKQGYTFAKVSPGGDKLLLGWGEAFGIKSKTVDKLTQGNRYGGQNYTTDATVTPVPENDDIQQETGRSGSVVLAAGERESSTGRVYRISDYTEPQPTELVLYSAILAEDSSTIIVDLEDIIAELDEDYEILKVYIETAGPTLATTMQVLTNAGVTGDNRCWLNIAGTVSSDEFNGLWRLYVGSDIASSYTLTFHNFRSNDTFITMFAEGGAYFEQHTAAGYIDVVDAKPLTTLLFTADTGTFNAGNRVAVSALRTRGKYSNGVENDYRMA